MQRELEAPSDDRLPMPRDPEEGPAPSVLAVLPRALPVGRQAPTNTPPESTARVPDVANVQLAGHTATPEAGRLRRHVRSALCACMHARNVI